MNAVPALHFFTEADVLAMLHLADDEIPELLENRVLLSLRLSSGERCFPSFQFPEDDLDGNLISLFQLFPEAWDGWEITNWFHKPNSYLSAATPIECFKANGITDTLRLIITTELSLLEL